MLLPEREQLVQQQFYYGVRTQWGDITLAGGNFSLSEDAPLLTLETGADTRYGLTGCTRSFAQPVSVCLDLGGNDNYGSVNPDWDPSRCAFGAGIMGYAVVLDASGDDRYSADYANMGCGILGAGVLVDSAGADRYWSTSACAQGSGIYGTGMLIDLAGDDTYELAAFGQGYGGTLGAGLLLDVTGNDTYTGIEQSGQENGGPFGAQHFIHFTQGAAYGRRADYTDGHSWAGGVRDAGRRRGG